MYYKIRNDVLFRQYSGFGYLSDNSEFGYQFLNDNHLHPGERYVSESGAVMLSTLDKEPRFIDDIVDELMQIFIEVDRDELKHDTMNFFDGLKDQGYLSSGETADSCQDHALLKQKTLFHHLQAFHQSTRCIPCPANRLSLIPYFPYSFVPTFFFDLFILLLWQ